MISRDPFRVMEESLVRIYKEQSLRIKNFGSREDLIEKII